MARGRPAKGITKKQTEEPAVMEEPQQQSGSRYSMRTRPQSKPVGDTKENAKTEQKKKTPGRKRKAVPAEEEETTVVKEAEPAKVEETTKEEEKEEGKEEEEKNDEATESSKASQEGEIKVNRAPVLTMWVAAVAERQGFTFDEAVTFGKAISGLFAHSKGKKIGVIESDAAAESPEKKKAKKVAEKFDVFGNSVYGKTTDKGRFALESGKAIAPNSVKAYLHRAFKNDYDRVREAFEALANSLQPEEIGSRAYHLYEKFRPEVPEGAKGWGARGLLDLKHVQELAASG